MYSVKKKTSKERESLEKPIPNELKGEMEKILLKGKELDRIPHFRFWARSNVPILGASIHGRE